MKLFIHTKIAMFFFEVRYLVFLKLQSIDLLKIEDFCKSEISLCLVEERKGKVIELSITLICIPISLT